MAPTSATERSLWRAVAVPSEHGGWGLTLEPVLLGLIVGWSIGGVGLAVAAFVAFVVRTPLKLLLVDVHRDRWLDRSRLAVRFVVGELVVMVAAVTVVVWAAGWSWVVPAVVALPLVAVQTWFDVRSRGRRLVPELCGAVGIAAVVASIVLSAGRDGSLAVALWLVLAARAVGAIPFVRVQILRLRRGAGSVRQSDVAQVLAVATAVAAVVVDSRLAAGLVGVLLLAVAQTVWVRRAPVAPKVLGLRQMALGLGLVVVTAVGVLVS